MRFLLTICLFLGFLVFPACEEKPPSLQEQLLGSWSQPQEDSYIRIQLNPEGLWGSHVKIANPRSKIVAMKGDASGIWYVREKQLVLTVGESTIDKVWEKNSIHPFTVEDITPNRVLLKKADQDIQWEREGIESQALEGGAPVLSVAPIAVNLDKISSNTADAYLCVKIDILLKELMPGAAPPEMHPRIREAAVLFFSSLIHDQVISFDKVDIQKEALLKVLNPYLGGAIKQIDVKKILIASSYEKVEEFLMEFAPPVVAPAAEEE